MSDNTEKTPADLDAFEPHKLWKKLWVRWSVRVLVVLAVFDAFWIVMGLVQGRPLIGSAAITECDAPPEEAVCFDVIDGFVRERPVPKAP
jgi:hypothetical protein